LVSTVNAEEALAMVGAHVDEYLLLGSEYLAAKSDILEREGWIKLNQREQISTC
jgi:hypothetical protein